MKPASIISLIVAVMLVITGFVTCMIAKNMAEAEGHQLLTENREYGYVNTTELEDMPVSKLEISVNDASINIYGNCETSYVELINFRESYYSLSAANRVVSFDEIPDVTSMLKFWENGFSFKGMRYLLDFNRESAGEKVINIYLSQETSDLKIVSITGENCDVYLETLSSPTEYTVELTSGSVTTYNVHTGSAFLLSGEDVSVALSDTIIHQLTIHSTELQLACDNFNSNLADIAFDTGSMTLTPNKPVGNLNYAIMLETGTILVNGTEMGTTFQQNATSNMIFTVSAKDATVILQDPEMAPNEGTDNG